MNVLSLFNGMSTGRLALENVGIKVNKYYSSEIKPYAIKLTQHHFPDTIQVGDITKWEEWDIEWSKIDLVLSGSPCQNLSVAGQREGIHGEKSKLFFTFIDILNHIKKVNPKVLFFQENVGSASGKDIYEISKHLGVHPVRINSKLVTAQLRDRYYWSNIRTKVKGLTKEVYTDIPQPKDRGIMLKDVLTSGTCVKSKHTCLTEKFQGALKNTTQKYLKKRNKTTGMLTLIEEKHICLTERYQGACSYKDRKSQKCQDFIIKRAKRMMTTPIQEDTYVRIVNKVEMCRLQGFPDNYCDILTEVQAGSVLGDGWTLPIIEHIFKYINKED